MKNLTIMAALVVAAPFAGFFASEPAKAEDGCPAGMRPNPAPSGTPGANQCVPGYSGSPEAPPVPSGRWATRWGAYADDQETGKVGMASGMSSKGKATKAAIAHCQSKGGVNCQLVMTYNNQCAVVIAGERDNGTWYRLYQSAATIEEASSLGEEDCQKQGAKDCKVYFSDCSLAEWVG